MTAYFEERESHKVVSLPIKAEQDSYEVSLPPGTYLAYTWLPDFSQGGVYSEAVVCGLKPGCSDHTPRPITVRAGETLEGVDLCDWFAGPFNVPYPPQTTPEAVSIGYPGGTAPALRVVAFNLKTNNWYYVNVLPGNSVYTITELPPGSYQVVAYTDTGSAGGHTGGSGTLEPVTVQAGEINYAASIDDWNGSFPEDPTRREP
jgi:hypothetical protein